MNKSVSSASKIKSPPRRLALASFTTWPKLSPKTFVDLLSRCKKQLWLSFEDSFIQGQYFCVNLCFQYEHERPRLLTESISPFKFHNVAYSVLQKMAWQTLPQLNTSKSKGRCGILARVIKPVLLNLSLISKKFAEFLHSWCISFVLESSPHLPYPKKLIILIHSATVPLQSLHSFLKQRPTSLADFFPSLKQTIQCCF